MKIKIISDLHIDHNRAFKLNTKFDDAFTIIAGDISQVEGGKENLLANVKNGIWVAGNHDYWTESDIDSGIKKWNQLYPTSNNFSFLENNYKIIDDVVFIGATLWTNFNLYKDPVRSFMTVSNWPDFHYNHVKHKGVTKLMTTTDMIDRFNKSVEYIEKILNKFKNKTCVLITHFVPSTLGVSDKYKTSPSTPFFASNLDYLFLDHDNLKLCVFGHTHTPFDFNINKCRCICNPRGYLEYGEGNNFNPNLMIEINE